MADYALYRVKRHGRNGIDIVPHPHAVVLEQMKKTRLTPYQPSVARIIPIPYFSFKGSLVDPRLRATNRAHRPTPSAFREQRACPRRPCPSCSGRAFCEQEGHLAMPSPLLVGPETIVQPPSVL